jgi:Ser/Thr protein kinase RdoA (MazF antagonist)
MNQEKNMDQPFGAHPLAGKFNDLTPENVLDAVEAEGRRCTGRFIILNSYENRVYQLELDDETMVVGKFYRPGRWSKEAILAEHQFLKELEEVEIPVATPIDLGDGETIGTVDGIYYSLFPRKGGRNPEELGDEQVQMLGRLVGRIHNIGAMAPAPERINLNPTSYGRANLNFLLENDLIPYDARENFKLTVESLLMRIEPMFNGIKNIRIHGDCHFGNVLWTPDGATFLDFDDMANGPAVQDIWMLVPGYDEHARLQREVLIEAYESFREFDRQEMRLIEPLRALRYIHYASWIARRWEDPIFKRTFEHFGTVQYWQKETLDLREQIGRIDMLTY